MPTSVEYQAILHQHYPELEIVSAELNTLGQSSDILIVDDTLIFRFPRYKSGIQQLETEVRLLTVLQGKLALPIPNPQYMKFSAEAEACWVGYEMIQGEPFWRDDIHALSADTQAHYAQQLGDFLRALHQIPRRDLPNLRNDDKLKFWQDFYTQIESKLFQFMRHDAIEHVQVHFENYVSNAKKYKFKPTLRHGDFGTVNILHDGTTITGIIDFGDAALGDPAMDYAALRAGYGEDFLKMVVNDETYLAEMMPRIEFYIGTYALFEALHGYDNDDLGAFEAGMENYT